MDPDKDKATSDVANETDGGKDTLPDSESETAQGSAPTDEAITDSSTEDSKPGTPAPPPATAKPGRGIGIVALILALVACIATAYSWYRQEVQGRHQQELTAANLTGELRGVTEGIRALEKQQDRLSADQDKLVARQDDLAASIKEELESSVNALQKQQEALTGSVSKMYESMDRSIDSWALEEVEQLLRMANNSVSLAGDIATGIIAFDYADKRLSELGNPELLEVRRLIAEEIGQLKSLDQVDLPGLAFRLAGIISTVDQLPLVNKPTRPGAGEQSDSAESTEEENMWMKAGSEILDDLKGLVRIQNTAEPAKPLLAPEQRYFLTGNLRLLLSGAQIAVLRADTNTFKANLEQASQILKDYFDTGEQSVKSILAELDEMSGETLATERPNVSGSITKLQEIKPKVTPQ